MLKDFLTQTIVLTPTSTIPYKGSEHSQPVTNEKIYWRLRPKVNFEMRWYHLILMLNDVSKQIQRDNHDPRQVTLFYYKFKEHKVKEGQPNLKSKKKKEIQSKLLY